MNYIPLIKLTKANYQAYPMFYIDSPRLGESNNENTHLIGTFKGDSNWQYLFPFKTVQNQGTYREYKSYYGQYYAPYTTSKYTFALNKTSYPRQIIIYKNMWVDDTPDYDSLLTFTRTNYYEKVYLEDQIAIVPLPIIFDGTYYFFAENKIFDILNKTQITCISKWLSNSEIWTKKMDNVVKYSDIIVPGFYTTYTHYEGTPAYTRFMLRINPHDDFDATVMRRQVASDSDFTNLLVNMTYTITYNSTYDRYGSYGFNRDIYETDKYLTQYARVRLENSDGSKVGNWSQVAILDYNNPQNYDYNTPYNYAKYPTNPVFVNYPPTFPPGYSGKQTVKNVFSFIQRGNFFDVIKFVSEVNVSNGSITSKYHKIYIDEYTLNGDFVSSNLIYSITQTHYNFPWGQYVPLKVINGVVYGAFVDTDSLKIRVFKFDGTNITNKTISVPAGQDYFVGWQALIFYGKELYFTATDENNSIFKIYNWNWNSETSILVNLPSGMEGKLSASPDDDGFWFEFDDGTYVGIAWYSTLRINRAMSFNQFQRNSMRR